MNQLTTSVIIPTRNRHGNVINFLQSLAMQTELPNQIIIIDSSDVSLTESSQFVEMFSSHHFHNTELIFRCSEPGLTYQRNVGLACTSTDLSYFFDDDIILEPDFLQQQNNIFRNKPEFAAGMGAVKRANTTWSLNRLLRILFLMQRENAGGAFTFSGMPTHAYGRKQFLSVEVLGGCNMVFRTEVVKKYLFDERLRFYSYMEDCDISKRLSCDHKMFYNPYALLDHVHSPLNRDNVVKNRAMYIKNYSYLFFKNFYPENQLRLLGYFWTIIGLFIEAMLARNMQYICGYCRGLHEYYGCGRKP